MPWSPEDADKHKKGLTPKQQRQWAHVANSVLEACLKGGGSQKACEGRAVRAANSQVGEVKKESDMGLSIEKVNMVNIMEVEDTELHSLRARIVQLWGKGETAPVLTKGELLAKYRILRAEMHKRGVVLKSIEHIDHVLVKQAVFGVAPGDLKKVILRREYVRLSGKYIASPKTATSAKITANDEPTHVAEDATLQATSQFFDILQRTKRFDEVEVQAGAMQGGPGEDYIPLYDLALVPTADHELVKWDNPVATGVLMTKFWTHKPLGRVIAYAAFVKGKTVLEIGSQDALVAGALVGMGYEVTCLAENEVLTKYMQDAGFPARIFDPAMKGKLDFDDGEFATVVAEVTEPEGIIKERLSEFLRVAKFKVLLYADSPKTTEAILSGLETIKAKPEGVASFQWRSCGLPGFGSDIVVVQMNRKAPAERLYVCKACQAHLWSAMTIEEPVCAECGEGMIEKASDVVANRTPYNSVTFNEKPWDGAASRFTTQQYVKACAWVNPDVATAELKKKDAVLFHHEPDGAISIRGLLAARAALAGADMGLSEDVIEKIQAHLDRHWAAAKSKGLVEKMLSMVADLGEGRAIEFNKATAGRTFSSTEPEEHIVGGIVYEADVPDYHGDWTDADEIQKAMYGFMEQRQSFTQMHEPAPVFTRVLECFQAQQDVTHDGGDVKKGAWYMKVRVLDEEVWKKIKNEEYTGFSMGGFARRKKDVAPPAVS